MWISRREWQNKIEELAANKTRVQALLAETRLINTRGALVATTVSAKYQHARDKLCAFARRFEHKGEGKEKRVEVGKIVRELDVMVKMALQELDDDRR